MHDDIALLREYTNNQSEQAFETVVARHVNLVYSAALRQVRDPYLAEEITQVVFILLARKAQSLSGKVVVSGWLYRTVNYVAADARKAEVRRARREQEAMIQSGIEHNADEEIPWHEVSPLLDQAMERLGQGDRDAMILRYFENRGLKEVALALGVPERTAQKRVQRALEKMRKFLAQRGLTLTAGSLSDAVSLYSIQAAPIGLVKTATAGAMIKATALSTSSLTYLSKASKLMAWTKIKTAIAAGAGILLVGSTATLTLRQSSRWWSHSWQIARPNRDGLVAMNNAPPQVRILPSKFEGNERGGRLIDDIPPRSQWRYIGSHESLFDIVKTAYLADQLPSSLIVLPPEIQTGFYDYVANLPNGSEQALQAFLRKEFGLSGRREMRETDVLLLKPAVAGVVDLKPGNGKASESANVTPDGVAHYKKMTMNRLARLLEHSLDTPVVDATGLKAIYEIDWPEITETNAKNKLESARDVLSGFGLELQVNRRAHEFFIIEKVQ